MDQTVPGSTPSKRRVTRDGVIHSGMGVGRHCGRSTGVALDLMHTSNPQKQNRSTRSNITDHDKQPKHRPTQTHPRRNQTAPRPEPSNHPENERRRRQKKKEGVQIEVGELVQDEETQREPQTPRRGFSPAPERKRKKERTRRRRNQPNKREAEGRKQKTNTGRGLKGSKYQRHNDP